MSYLDWCKTPAGIQWLDILEYSSTPYNAFTYMTHDDLLTIYNQLEISRMPLVQHYIANIMYMLHSTVCSYYDVVFAGVIWPDARNSWKARSKLPYDVASAIAYMYTANLNTPVYNLKSIVANYSYFTTSGCEVTCTCWYYRRGEYAPNRTRIKPCEYHTRTSCCLLSSASAVTHNVRHDRNHRPFDVAGYYRLMRRKRRIDSWYECIIKRIHEEMEAAFYTYSTISECFSLVLKTVATSSAEVLTRAVPL